MTVSVVIPTLRRPDGLRLAIQSVLAQSRRPEEIVIVDNSPQGDARGIVDNTRAVARCPVIYVHEARPGISNARNAGLAAASGRYIAFLDDDEIASVDWLYALLTTATELGADIVFGPLRAELDDPASLPGQLATRLYSRPGPAGDVHLDKPFGCGNCLIDRAGVDLPDPPFDPAMNRCGGEDDVLFARLAGQGARFAWSAQAKAVEVVGEARSNWRHLLARSFAFGQGATQACVRPGAANWAAAAFWMSVGLAQLVIYAPLALVTALLRRRFAVTALDKAVQGAGKLIWFSGLEPQFYGQAEPYGPAHSASLAGSAPR
jgi:succinoglycan biosynthesis protein ExoM